MARAPIIPSLNLSTYMLMERVNPIVFWVIVGILALAFGSWLPFQTDMELYNTIASKSTTIVATLTGYFRYLMFVVAGGFVYYWLLQVPDRHNKLLISVILKNYWLFGWMLLLAFSFVLSPAMHLNPVEGIVQLSLLHVGVFLVVYLGRSSLVMSLLYFTLIVCLVVSYVGVALLPDRSTHAFVAQYVSLNENLQGLWRGMFSHKNIAGGFFMQLLLLCVPMALAGQSRILAAAAAVGAGIFLYFAGSMSSFFTPVIAIIVVGSVLLVRPLGLIVPDAFATLYLAAPFLVALFLANYGLSLDNRDVIWQTGIAFNRGHEILGHGYLNGFGTVAMNVFADARWMRLIGHSHSGTMDTYIYFGAVGLAVLWLTVRTVLKNYVRLMTLNRNDPEFWFDVAGMLVFVSALTRSMVAPDILTSRGGWLIVLISGLLPSVQLYRAYQPSVRREGGMWSILGNDIERAEPQQ